VQLEDLKDLIIAKMDETSLLDFLDISMAELVDILEEQISERQEDFESSVGT